MPEPDPSQVRRQRIVEAAMMIQIVVAAAQLVIEALRFCGAPC